jgi:predicted  nucleic acid-binding Zn-ribbon protein
MSEKRTEDLEKYVSDLRDLCDAQETDIQDLKKAVRDLKGLISDQASEIEEMDEKVENAQGTIDHHTSWDDHGEDNEVTASELSNLEMRIDDIENQME